MKDFSNIGLPAPLLQSLQRMKILTPTPIQSAAIPVALAGHDILASAQTGSGKTLAYAIPLIVKLMQSPNDCGLILTPTRELATQVYDCLHQLLGHSFKAALLIGGASMFPQINALKKRPQIIIGTPGRIADHLARRTLKLNATKFLIVDEADRMLDMGFGIQLDHIAEFLPQERQTLMFSATFPPNIQRLSQKYLKDPQRITIESEQSKPKIKQEVVRTSHSEKFPELLKQLEQRKGSVIIFTRTKRGADRLSEELKDCSHKADAIHGDLSQRQRDRVIRNFRDEVHSRILVATDIAARGLDIPHIMHVINYDLPQCPEDYIHRIGRTGRAGAEGNSLCFVTPQDHQKWRSIARLINPEEAAASSKKFGGDETRSFAPRRRNRRPSFPRNKGSGFPSKSRGPRF